MDMWLIGQIGGELAMCIMGTGVFDRWVSLLILGEKEEGEAAGGKCWSQASFSSKFENQSPIGS